MENMEFKEGFLPISFPSGIRRFFQKRLDSCLIVNIKTVNKPSVLKFFPPPGAKPKFSSEYPTI